MFHFRAFACCLFAIGCSFGSARADDAPPTFDAQAARVISRLPAPPTVAPTPLAVPSANPSAPPLAVPTPKPTAAPAPATSVALNNEPLREAARRLKLPLPLPQAHIIVWKATRRLELWSGTRLVKTYRVALGGNPQGHKQKQGDGRTPEGQFYICTRNASTSSFHIFLGLSYPALPDAQRGVQGKAISWREYQLIRARLASRGAPLWGTRLGGWVGIHGGSDAAFARKRAQERGTPDWTAGCIALTNAQIEELFAATKLGTPVLVRP